MEKNKYERGQKLICFKPLNAVLFKDVFNCGDCLYVSHQVSDIIYLVKNIENLHYGHSTNINFNVNVINDYFATETEIRKFKLLNLLKQI